MPGIYKKYRKYSTKPKTKKPVVSKTVKKYVKKELRKHTPMKNKYFLANEATMDTTTQSYFQELSTISQGTSNENRNGNKIKVTGLHINGFMNNNTGKTNYVRVLVVATNEPADVTTSSELLETIGGGTASIAGAAGLNALYHPVNKTKFRVLYDKIYKLGPSTSVDGAECCRFKIWRRLNQIIKYESTGTGADNQSTRIHMAVIPSEANDDTQPSTIEISYCARTFFVDA